MTGFAVSESAVWTTVRRPLLVILDSIWTSTASKNLVVQSLTTLKMWMCVRKDSTWMRCLNTACGNTMRWIWLIAAMIFFHHLDPYIWLFWYFNENSKTLLSLSILQALLLLSCYFDMNLNHKNHDLSPIFLWTQEQEGLGKNWEFMPQFYLIH